MLNLASVYRFRSFDAREVTGQVRCCSFHVIMAMNATPFWRIRILVFLIVVLQGKVTYGQSRAIHLAPTPTIDPCISYSHLSERSRNIHSRSSRNCDASLNGWYRFSGEAGTKLSNRCINRACGATYSGWMYGSLPNRYEGIVSRTLFFTLWGDCYRYMSTTFVKNCNGFYVYYLRHDRNIPCDYRYCGMGDLWYMTPSASPSPTPSTSLDMMLSTEVLQPTPVIPELDPCKNYKVLSDPSRATTYRDWNSDLCDSHLHGWFRFMGQAGTRMKDSCSNHRSSYYYQCGSYYQGWLHGPHPSVYEGKVARTVCFSRLQNCYCRYRQSIQVKNCGTYYVYWLDGTPTCSLRYCGFKERTTKVSCSSNYMRIDLFTQFYDASRYSKISLRDERCTAHVWSNAISLGSTPNACGGTREETSKYIIYKNEVILKVRQNSGMITRDHDEVIEFSCKYERDGYTSAASFLPVSSIKGNESSIGAFSFYFAMFRSRFYRYQHYLFPVKVQLRESLYFQASANVNDNGLVLLIDQCYSTPTMDRHDPARHILINNGCPADDTVEFLPTNGQRSRFSIQAFRYLNNQSAVYIHCLVLLCQNSSRDYRCAFGCSGNNINRGRRDISDPLALTTEEDSHSQYYLLEAGPITLKDEEGSSKNQGGTPKTQNALMTTVISLVVGVIALAVVVVILLIKMRRNGNETGRVVKDVGIDNVGPNGKDDVITDEVNGEKSETVM